MFPCHCLQVKQLLSSTMDEVTSSLHTNDGLGIQNLVLSAVGLGEYLVFSWGMPSMVTELTKLCCACVAF
jgi:hypothetical protein